MNNDLFKVLNVDFIISRLHAENVWLIKKIKEDQQKIKVIRDWLIDLMEENPSMEYCVNPTCGQPLDFNTIIENIYEDGAVLESFYAMTKTSVIPRFLCCRCLSLVEVIKKGPIQVFDDPEVLADVNKMIEDTRTDWLNKMVWGE